MQTKKNIAIIIILYCKGIIVPRSEQENLKYAHKHVKISFSCAYNKTEKKKKTHLSSKHIQCKSIETTDDSLLNVQTKVVQSPHSGEQ